MILDRLVAASAIIAALRISAVPKATLIAPS